MPIAITDTQRDLAEAVRACGSGWPELTELGLFSLCLPEPAGGLGGPVVDLAVALSAAAERLAPGPVLPTALAGLVLGRHDGPCAVHCGPSELVARPRADGGLLISGRALALGEPGALLLSAGGTWVLAEGGSPVGGEPLDPSRPLTEVDLDEELVPAERVIGTAPVTDLLATLAAAEAVGIAEWCLRTAVEYARVRTQFGRPIGSFQAVKHLCVEMLCRAEQAAAVAWDAACAADQSPGELPLAAAVAAAIALDAAVDNAKDCIQVLGGIGFTWEHDAHRYLRRAVASRQLLGGSARWRRRVASLAGQGQRRTLHVDLAADREPVRAVVASIAGAADQRVALAESGYLAPHWPKPYGLDAAPAEQLVIEEELRAAGIGRPDLVIGWWAVPTILAHGTEAQRERFAGPTLRGDLVWCQLFSEPEAGSDLASLRTRAVRAPGGWRLTGQKVWTSLAREADWAICLARTDERVAKHKGITYFLVDMRSPGIQVRPLREITGDAVFNEVFLDEVFVPDDCVVGEVNGGWRLARTTLANERVAMGGGSSLGKEVERVLAHEPGAEHAERIGALVAQGLAVSLLDLRGTLNRLGGHDPGAGSSVRKLVGVRHRQSVAEAALDLLGPAGAVAGECSREFLLTRCLSIAGGTTQVLLTLAAEQLLGLPRQ
ncbi:acyl-CoA dehydrogenase [Kutzneria viridogrisea]|uniref:Alkylation response protein AidB-like acyl-CoA dehydrogenase n=1 Tax=Kutzneria viridogrisea TaxID=47990 RepID=A0ABR6BNS3_9PSEU|nr:alkylation response protein AidB-like acyl-CoA dehydrogenase [Kutzneria viridogrisea]